MTIMDGIQNELLNSDKVIKMFEFYSDILYEKMNNIIEIRSTVLLNLDTSSQGNAVDQNQEEEKKIEEDDEEAQE